jgi:hypothetical protein
VLLRLSYLALTSMIRFLRLPAMSNTDKNIKSSVGFRGLELMDRHMDKVVHIGQIVASMS